MTENLTGKDVYESAEFAAFGKKLGIPAIDGTKRLTVVLDLETDCVDVIHEYRVTQTAHEAKPQAAPAKPKSNRDMWGD